MLFSMPGQMQKPKSILPNDMRQHLGGMLFLVSLLVFFLSSILLYLLYAYWRRDDPQTDVPMPPMFLISTACLLLISVLVHWATRTVRREKRVATSVLLSVSGIAAIAFMGFQFDAMYDLLQGPALQGGTGKGVAGMVVVLAILHALHVAGGVIALGIVSVRSSSRRSASRSRKVPGSAVGTALPPTAAAHSASARPAGTAPGASARPA